MVEPRFCDLGLSCSGGERDFCLVKKMSRGTATKGNLSTYCVRWTTRVETRKSSYAREGTEEKTGPGSQQAFFESRNHECKRAC